MYEDQAEQQHGEQQQAEGQVDVDSQVEGVAVADNSLQRPHRDLQLSVPRRRIKHLSERIQRLQRQLEDETGALTMFHLFTDTESEAQVFTSLELQDLALDKILNDRVHQYIRAVDIKRKGDPKRDERFKYVEDDQDELEPTEDDDDDLLKEPLQHHTPHHGLITQSQMLAALAQQTMPVGMSLMDGSHQMVMDSDDGSNSGSNRKALRNQVAHLVQRLNGGKRLPFKGSTPDFWPAHIKFCAPSAIDAPSTLRELIIHLSEQIKMRAGLGESIRVEIPRFPKKKRKESDLEKGLGASQIPVVVTTIEAPLQMQQMQMQMQMQQLQQMQMQHMQMQQMHIPHDITAGLLKQHHESMEAIQSANKRSREMAEETP